MINDLNDIYDGGVSSGNTGEPPKGGDDVLHSDYMGASGTGLVGRPSNLDVRAYTGYLGPIYEQQGNLDLRRGEAQSNLEKLGNSALRTTAKIGTGFVEMAGDIGTLLYNPNNDYSNTLTEAGQSANAWLDKNFPLYRTTEGTTGFSDLSWWLQNTEGLISSIASFAAGGAVIAKGFGAIGKALRIGKNIERAAQFLTGDLATGTRIAQLGEQTLTAGMLAYAEGAMSGKNVFDTVYKAQYAANLRKGYSAEDADAAAKKTASESAHTAVQLNTVINTGMNMAGGMSMFFNHGRNKVIDTAKRVLTQRAGESAPAYMARLATETGEKYAKDIVERMSMGKAFTIGREAGAEGIEELTNQFSERTGIEEGSKGNTMDFFEQFGQLSKYFDRTMDEDGALSFALGAIGGPTQGAVTQNIPIHKIKTGIAETDGGAMANAAGDAATSEKDAASTYLGKKFNYVSKRNLEKFHQTQYFDDIKDKYAADAKFIVDTNAGIEAALKKGDALEAERLRNDMFNVMNLQTVRMGHTDAMKETYKSIASVDNTKTDTPELQEKVDEQTALVEEMQAKGEDSTQAEADLKVLENALENSKGETAAMKLGLTDSTENNDYKEKAQEAMRDLDTLQKMHDKTMAKYGTDGDSYSIAQGHVSDFIFNRQAQTFLLKKDKARYEKELSELEIDENDFTDDELEAAMETGTAFNEGIDRYHSAKNMIANIRAMLGRAKANPTPENLAAARKVLDKIGSLDTAVADDADSMVKAIGTAEKALDHQDRILERELGEQQQTMAENSLEFQAWQTKNPDSNLRDYVNENYGEKSKRSTKEAYQKHIAEIDALIKMHEGYLVKLKDSRTLTTITKNAEKFYETLAEKAAEEAAELNRQHQLDAKIDQERKAIEQQALRAARMKTVLEAQTIRAQVVEQQRTIERLQGKLLSPLLLTNAQTLETAAQLDAAKQTLAHLKHNLIVLTQQIDEYTNRINGTFEELSEEAKAMAEVEEARMKEEAEKAAAQPEPKVKTPPKPKDPTLTRTFEAMDGRAVNYNGEEYRVEVQPGGRVELVNSTTIVEVPFGETPESFGVSTKTLGHERYVVQSIQEGEVTINDELYAINTATNGMVVSLTPANDLNQAITNEGMLVAVEIARNELDNSYIKEQIEADPETVLEVAMDLGLAHRRIQTALNINWTNSVETAMTKLTDTDEQLMPAEKLAVQLWVNDAFERLVALSQEGVPIEVVENTLDSLNNILNQTYEDGNTQTEEQSESAIESAPVEPVTSEEEAVEPSIEEPAEPIVITRPPLLPATQAFFQHLDTLSEPKRRYAEQTRTSLLAQQLPFSLDLLGKGGELTMQLMKEHLAELELEVLEAQEIVEEVEKVAAVSEAVEQRIPVSEITAPPPIPSTSTLPIDEYIEPVIPVEKPQHSDEYIPQTGLSYDGAPPILPIPLPDNDRNWDGRKLIEGHDKLATRTAEYTQNKDEAGRSMQSTGLLNDGAGDGFNYDVIDPLRAQKGTSVWFEVATDFDGLYNDYKADTGDGEQKRTFRKFAEFTTGNKVNGVPEIKDIANVPIRVMSEDAQGRPQMLGYYPTADRMTATNSDLGGDERFRNIQNTLRDKEGNVIETDNAQKEYDKTLALRKQLIQAYYDGVKIKSTITGVSQGVPFHTKQAGSAADRIKGKSRIGIVRDGVVVGVTDITLPPMDEGMAEVLENKSVAILLMPNGEYYPALIQSEKLYTLGEDKTAKQQETFNTVKRVIELHALAQLGEEKSPEVKKEFADIEAVTRFDIATYDGFRSFITQYYTHFSAVDKFIERGADDIILHNYEEPSAKGDTGIYISSISGASTSKVPAKLNEDGTLSEEFSAKLEELLANRYKMIVTKNSNLKLKNVNESGEFKSLVYMFKEKTETEKAGMRWVEAKTFNSYNDYLLSQMQTKVSYYKSQTSEDGSIQLDRSDEAPGKTVKHWNYGANPVRSFNIGPIQSYKKRASTQETTLTPKVKDESAVVPDEVADILSDMFGDHKSKTVTRFEIPRAKLEEMYNFTPQHARNGKSVEQVINELTKAQMTDLKSGWNPFSRC